MEWEIQLIWVTPSELNFDFDGNISLRVLSFNVLGAVIFSIWCETNWRTNNSRAERNCGSAPTMYGISIVKVIFRGVVLFPVSNTRTNWAV